MSESRPPLPLLHDDEGIVAVSKPSGEPVIAERGGSPKACLRRRLESQVGKRLWVVQNSLNQVAEVRLAPDHSSGEVVSITTNDSFRIPTTVARQGNTLAVVNARFDVAPTPTTEYEIVTFRR